MKPIKLFLQLSLLTIGIFNLYAQEVKRVNIKFDLMDFNITYDGENTYSIETVNLDYFFPEDPSLPAIPLKGIRVLVPNGAEYVDSQIEHTECIVGTDIVLTMAPVLGPTNSMILAESTESEFNDIFPDKVVEFKTSMIQRGVTCFSFTVSPFRYDGSRQKLVFIEEIILEIKFRINPDMTSVIRPEQELLKSIKSRLVNPSDISRYYPTSTMSSLKSTHKVVDYLIVTTEELKSEFEPLLEWKTRKGLSVDIITTEEIEEKYTDDTIQLKIKRCLKEYYTKHALRWALLAGDHDIVPIQRCFGEIYSGRLRLNDKSIPTDLFYACFDKRFDWNSYLNDKIGQRYLDDIDLVPEIYISRIPVRNKEQVNTFVNKTIEYETNMSRSEYNSRMLLAGVKISSLWEGKSDSHHRSDFIMKNFISGRFNGEWNGFFDTGTDFPGGDVYHLTSTNLISQINSGYGLIHFSGHGNEHGIYMESGNNFNSHEAMELNNALPGIFISNSCYMSAFDKADPCLAEALLNNPKGGSVACFGSSRLGFSNMNPCTELGSSLKINANLIKYLLEEKTDPDAGSFATLASRAKTDFVDYGCSGGVYEYLLFSINALGDPEMPIFSANPIRFEDVDIARYGNSITVNTGGGISRICITSHDLEMGFQQVAENVSSHTFHNVPDSIQVVITAPNYIPYRYFNPCQNPIDSITGMEKGFDTYIRIYPNPTDGQISVNCRGLETYSIKITSLDGQLLHSMDFVESDMRIDLSTYQKGIYLVTVSSREHAWTEKIIKL